MAYVKGCTEEKQLLTVGWTWQLMLTRILSQMSSWSEKFWLYLYSTAWKRGDLTYKRKLKQQWKVILEAQIQKLKSRTDQVGQQWLYHIYMSCWKTFTVIESLFHVLASLLTAASVSELWHQRRRTAVSSDALLPCGQTAQCRFCGPAICSTPAVQEY